MTVEDQRGCNSVNEKMFPVGMRVLAVDDDPICLKVLENLLRKCQYEGMFTTFLFFLLFCSSFVNLGTWFFNFFCSLFSLVFFSFF
jgi:hypothetical protein